MLKLLLHLLVLVLSVFITAEAQDSNTLSLVFGPGAISAVKSTLCAELATIGASLDSRYDDFLVIQDENGDVSLDSLQDATLLAEYFCMDDSASDDCDPVSPKAILTAVSESSEGGFVVLFTRSMPSDGTDYMQSVVLAGNRDVGVAVFHVPGCDTTTASSSSVLQLLASRTSQQLFLPASSPGDLPAVLHHHLNVTGRQRWVTLASAYMDSTTTGVRIVVSPQDTEMFVSVVCEDGEAPRIQTSIRSPKDRANYKVAGTESVYLARLSSPTPTQYAVYVRAVSKCRMLVNALTGVDRAALRFSVQADLGDDGIPMQSTLNPAPGGRSFILLPTVPAFAVERVEIVMPDGKSGRSAHSRRAAFSNDSLLVLGPISFPQTAFRLLVRGEVSRAQIRHQTRVFSPLDQTAEAIQIEMADTCSELDLTCPVASAGSDTLWTVNGVPIASGERVHANNTHLTISPLLLSENGRVSCSAISESEDINSAHFDVTTTGLRVPGSCTVCTALRCPFSQATWFFNEQQVWPAVDGPVVFEADGDFTLQSCTTPPEQRTGHYRCERGARSRSFTVLNADYVLPGSVPVDIFQDLQSHGLAETAATTGPVDVPQPPTRPSTTEQPAAEATTTAEQAIPDRTTTATLPPPPPPDTTQGPEPPQRPTPAVPTTLPVETTVDGGVFSRTTCQPLEVPRNGMVAYEETETRPVQVVARLLCDPGFLASGESTTVCIRALAQWALPIGRCQRQDPPVEVTTPPATTPRATTPPATTPPATTEPATTPAATTQPAPTQPGRSVACRLLPQPQHGVITEVKLGNGVTMARLRCDTGAVVSGTQFVVCSPVFDEWVGSLGSCALRGNPVPTTAPTPESTTAPTTTVGSSGCPDVPEVSNGMVSISSPFADLRVARLSCHIGTDLSGSNQIICRMDGRWIGQLGDCTLPIEATTVTATTTVTTTATPETTAMPDIDTTQPPVEPQGAEAPCGPLPPPSNGVINVKQINTIFLAKLECDSGYRASGVQQILCFPGASQWRSELGACREAVRLVPDTSPMTSPPPATTPVQVATTTPAAPVCTPSPRLANGIVSRQITADGLIISYLTCFSGYLLQGSRQRACNPEDGIWRGSLGSCVRPATTPPEVSTAPVTTPSSGACPSFPAVANGRYINRQIGSNLLFGRLVCDAGSTRIGPENIFCRRGEGIWRGKIGQCVQPNRPPTPPPATTVAALPTPPVVPLSCRSRSNLVNGRVSFVPARSILVATYSCNPGYNLVGHRTAVCIRLRWNRALPTCTSPGNPVPTRAPTPEATTAPVGSTGCPDVARVSNGMVSVSAPFSDLRVARLSCHAGATLSGSNQITCRMDGRWNGQLGECTLPLIPPRTDTCDSSVLTSLTQEVATMESRLLTTTKENTELRQLITDAQRRLASSFVGESSMRLMMERVSMLTAQSKDNEDMLSGCQRRMEIIKSAFDGDCPVL